ncbi:MAG: hypothetical protein Q4E48_01015 [Prevotella sp.]|jgi:hypothetical protein|nr:hypothetical protein [Prevotella sp.]
MKQLSLNEMLDLKGGISAKEYCKILGTIMANNDLKDDLKDIARDRWNEYCA